jgi:hypothetical protein
MKEKAVDRPKRRPHNRPIRMGSHARRLNPALWRVSNNPGGWRSGDGAAGETAGDRPQTGVFPIAWYENPRDFISRSE